jgi:hypothetical protein
MEVATARIHVEEIDMIRIQGIPIVAARLAPTVQQKKPQYAPAPMMKAKAA